MIIDCYSGGSMESLQNGKFCCDNEEIAKKFADKSLKENQPRELHRLEIELKNPVYIDANYSNWGWLKLEKNNIQPVDLFELVNKYRKDVVRSRFISVDSLRTFFKQLRKVKGYKHIDGVIIKNVCEGIDSKETITDYIIFGNNVIKKHETIIF